METNNNDIIVAISNGDINGIGYEVILKSLADIRITELCTPVVYGSAKVAAYHRKVLNLGSVNLNSVKSIEEIDMNKCNLVNCVDDNVRVELGKSTEFGGQGALASLEAALTDVLEGTADVLVTAPINKSNIQSETFHFPGHTEYLAAKCGIDPDMVLMLMISEGLRVGVATGHIPLANVPAAITPELIVQKLGIMQQSLKYDFGIRKPRIAVLGLNPHAGDEGLLGTDEIERILPAIQKANDMGITAMGPYPADGFFASGNFAKFDAILAMYHDQGLIPFKTLAGETGVNFTAGLPIVRTSPAHGTAFAIAGLNEANEESFRHAIYAAIDIVRNRRVYDEISANPLEIQERD